MKNEYMDEMNKVTCKTCGWSGAIKYTRETFLERHGRKYHVQRVFEYFCPECKRQVAQDIHEARMKDRARPEPLSASDRKAAELEP